MSVQFRYSQEENPDVPMMDIIVESYFGKSQQEKGKIDTGAAITVVPQRLVDTLELKKAGSIVVGGIFSPMEVRDTYEVHIMIGKIKFDLMQVIASSRSNVLIGRDLINLWILKLNGKEKLGELNVWSTTPPSLTDD